MEELFASDAFKNDQPAFTILHGAFLMVSADPSGRSIALDLQPDDATTFDQGSVGFSAHAIALPDGSPVTFQWQIKPPGAAWLNPCSDPILPIKFRKRRLRLQLF